MTSETPRDCRPRYATPRTSSRQTAGRYAASVARELGLPFMPWQQQVMDTALEIEDGQFVYREVIVTVPRQSGKSTALLSLILTRALMLSSQRIVYALALDTPIPTPSGWTTMGEIQVGDHVFGADGRPTRVLEVSAVHLNSPCRRVTFNDKTSIVASDDHLWETRKYGGSTGVRSTDEIARTLGQSRHYVRPPVLDRELEPYAGRRSWRSIVAAERVDSVPTRCIKVDAPDSLYLAGESLIPTHNTAQTRADARKLWFETWMPIVQASKFSEHFKARLANGDESLLFDNGSRQGLVASTMKAGHGQTLDLAIVDEAFSQADSRLEQALKPAMVTRSKQPHRGPQLWVVSTAGTLNASPYLWSKVENGRVLAESGHNKHVAYFEWSASEDDDPTDEETWWRCMPALGRTATLDAVRADYLSMELHEFMRAYLNCWTSISIDPVIPLSAWTALARSDLDTTGVSVAIAADITPGRDYSSVAASGTLSDGRQFVEVLAHRPGTDWVASFVEKLVDSNDVTSVVVDPAGPAVTLVDSLQRRGINFDGGIGRQVTTREHADAFSSLCDAVVEADKDSPLFVHTGQRDLTLALDGAAARDVGDGAKAWGRKNSGVDISPLVASTLAFWGAREDQRGSVWSLDEIVAQLRTEKQAEAPPGPSEENPGGLYYTPI